MLNKVQLHIYDNDDVDVIDADVDACRRVMLTTMMLITTMRVTNHLHFAFVSRVDDVTS